MWKILLFLLNARFKNNGGHEQINVGTVPGFRAILGKKKILLRSCITILDDGVIDDGGMVRRFIKKSTQEVLF